MGRIFTKFGAALLAGGLGLLAASAEPLNDDFADAETIAGPLPSTLASSNVDATTEPEEPDHAGSPRNNSVWFEYTPGANQRLQIDTFGSAIDTVLAVYTGSDLNALVEVASNDDSSGGFQSRVTFEAAAATTYRIAVAGFDVSETGAISLNLTEVIAPANDNFAAAQSLVGALPLFAEESTVGATAEASENDHAGSAASSSVWFEWSPSSTVNVVISTANSDFDTRLAVYTGSGLPLTLVTANDDEAPDLDVFTSRVSFAASAGTTYRIAVDGFDGDEGELVLSISDGSPPSNDDFALAEALPTALPATVQGFNLDATDELAEPSHGANLSNSVWYSWTPASDQKIRISASSTQINLALFAYQGASLGSLEVFGGFGSDSGDVYVNLDGQAGQTYWIAVDGINEAEGQFELGLEPLLAPGNDDFTNASSVPASLPSTATASLVGATKQAGEPLHASGSSPHGSIWFSWTSGVSAPVSVSTAGSNFDTVLGVYTGVSLGSLTIVGQNDDGLDALTSEVNFNAVSGTTYWIAVDATFGDIERFAGNTDPEGTVNLQIRERPANDDFASAQVLSPDPELAVSGNNSNATAESGEPTHAGAAGNSIWYAWTAPQSGQTLVDLRGAEFDTALAVYVGGSILTLNPVVSNNDFSPTDNTSRVVFNAQSGTTYLIAVDGNDASGAFELAIRPTTTFPIWAVGKGLGGSEALADANGDADGAVLLLEYAFAMDPNLADSEFVGLPSGVAGLPVARRVEDGGQDFLEVVYVRRIRASDLVYEVEFAADPGMSASVSGSEISAVAIDGTWERVTVRDSMPAGSQDARFGRVRVELFAP